VVEEPMSEDGNRTRGQTGSFLGVWTVSTIARIGIRIFIIHHLILFRLGLWFGLGNSFGFVRSNINGARIKVVLDCRERVDGIYFVGVTRAVNVVHLSMRVVHHWGCGRRTAGQFGD